MSEDNLNVKHCQEYKWDENNYRRLSDEGEVNHCSINEDELCHFPFCEEDLKCEKDEPQVTAELITEDKHLERVGKCTTTPTGEKSNSELFFECQKRLDKLAEEEREIENHKKEVFEKLKTDIETVFLALDCEELGTKIELTPRGLRISYPVHVLNDYQTRLFDTDLFTQLNNVIGMTGKFSMGKEAKIGGNYNYMVELIYEL